jgi:hypothetical protein
VEPTAEEESIDEEMDKEDTEASETNHFGRLLSNEFTEKEKHLLGMRFYLYL